MKTRYLTLLVSAFVGISVSQAQEWGNLKAKFVLDGKPPVPEKSKVDKDVAVCGKHKLVDETYIINAATGEIKNVVLFLSPKPGSAKPTVHPDYDKAPDTVELDNRNCHFEPHIVLMRTTQKLVIKNSDPVGHNTNANFLENVSFNDLIPAGGSITKPLPKPESAFMPLSCSIHPWMAAKILIRDDPYFGVSNDKGILTIEKIPVGKWTFTIWHEGCGFVTSGQQGGKEKKWTKGKIDIEIKKGDNDLGEFKIPVDVLKKPKK
jgi:hypothetical protein